VTSLTKQISIMGQKFQIKPVPMAENGHYSTEEHIIYVEKGACPAEVKSTVLHESIHILDDFLGIGLREKHVELLERGLFALIADNPKFWKE